MEFHIHQKGKGSKDLLPKNEPMHTTTWQLWLLNSNGINLEYWIKQRSQEGKPGCRKNRGSVFLCEVGCLLTGMGKRLGIKWNHGENSFEVYSNVSSSWASSNSAYLCLCIFPSRGRIYLLFFCMYDLPLPIGSGPSDILHVVLVSALQSPLNVYIGSLAV